MSVTHLSPAGMSAVINGKRYSVKAATLLADNDYWDGNNFARAGRNTFLYKTKGGAFFAAHLTQWQGERDHLEALSHDEALALWEELPEKSVTYEEAFDQEVVEAAAPGRPPLYDETMKLFSVWLTEEMIAWLKAQPGGGGEKIRALIRAELGQ